MSSTASGGLPPRIYLPIVALFGAAFVGIIVYFVGLGSGVTGSVFGKSAPASGAAAAAPGAQNSVEGGPPAAVMLQLKALRDRIAAHPDDDVAITQLGDMYLAANRFSEAIPLYQRALRVNPHNVAAQTGLEQARDALRQTGGP